MKRIETVKVVKYHCDNCGKECGNGFRIETYPDGSEKHYCSDCKHNTN